MAAEFVEEIAACEPDILDVLQPLQQQTQTPSESGGEEPERPDEAEIITRSLEFLTDRIIKRLDVKCDHPTLTHFIRPYFQWQTVCKGSGLTRDEYLNMFREVFTTQKHYSVEPLSTVAALHYPCFPTTQKVGKGGRVSARKATVWVTLRACGAPEPGHFDRSVRQLITRFGWERKGDGGNGWVAVSTKSCLWTADCAT
jgi:hypothetical protein